MGKTPPKKNNAAQSDTGIRQKMLKTLEHQRAAYLADGPPDAKTRIDRVDRAIALLCENKDNFTQTICEDFGHRPTELSLFLDILGTLESLRYVRKHLRRWMRPERRSAGPFGLLGGRAWIEYQPKGVVGILGTWNAPVNTCLAPLAGVLAAGNRAIIKPSEYTPRTAELLSECIQKAYDETEVAIFTGGPDVGKALSSLPFDHLMYTGNTAVARHIMRAASENLVPVTLELGGKSPVVVSRSARMSDVAQKVMGGKILNAGQVCLSPDYIFLPKDTVEEFVKESGNTLSTLFPSMKDNPDYPSVINERHYQRLQDYLGEAQRQGCRIIEINPAREDFKQQPHHKIPPTIVLEPKDDMKLMQEEIFGPVLVVKTYDQLEEAIHYINERPRPLGLYYFGSDRAECKDVLQRTTSGGVTVNDVILHTSIEDMPFGGIGPSGMGAYRGITGFKEFSHAKSVYKQSALVALMLRKLFAPPYSDTARKILARRTQL